MFIALTGLNTSKPHYINISRIRSFVFVHIPQPHTKINFDVVDNILVKESPAQIIELIKLKEKEKNK